MPTYDYCCTACGYQAEVMQKMQETPLKECPQCHALTLKRGIGGGIGVSFIGESWFKNGYTSAKKEENNPKENCCPCGKNQNSCSS